jgi:hypothetical protein
MKKHILPLLVLVTVFAACVKDKGATPADTLKSILLGKDTLSMYEGDVVQLNYAVDPSNYDPSKLVWKSSDTSIIAISSGSVKAKKAGLSKITVYNTVNTVSVSCLVTVKDTLRKGLIAYYPFNGSVGDSSGYANNGTAYNVTPTANRFGVANNAYYFNGINSYITVNDNPKLRLYNTDFTFNAWVSLDAYGSTYGSNILNKRLSGLNNGWVWSISGDLSLPQHVLSYGAGGGSVNAFGSFIIPVQSWHMLTTVYDNQHQQISIYIDGVLDSRVNNILTPNPAITALMYIGRDNPDVYSDGYFFKGALDDVRIYGRALSSNAIQKLFKTAY